MFAERATASLIVISPKKSLYEFFGFHLSLPIVISSSVTVSTSVILPISTAGA